MNREYHRWYSPSLGREMELVIFGHAGARVLVFPTSQGRFYEWEDRGMVATLSGHLERGWVQLVCVDSVDAESFYAGHRHPAERLACHGQYDRYLYDEVLPWMRAKAGVDAKVATLGASFGAYHALAFALRHPGAAGRVLGMHGLYDIRRFTDGYSDAFSNAKPNAFALTYPVSHAVADSSADAAPRRGHQRVPHARAGRGQ